MNHCSALVKLHSYSTKKIKFNFWYKSAITHFFNYSIVWFWWWMKIESGISIFSCIIKCRHKSLHPLRVWIDLNNWIDTIVGRRMGFPVDFKTTHGFYTVFSKNIYWMCCLESGLYIIDYWINYVLYWLSFLWLPT